MLIFVLRSTSDDWRGWSINLNLIHYPSPAKKWNAHFCITFNFWWLAGLVIGLKPHPPPVSSQEKWNAHFWIMFNFWWSDGLVDELESHLPPLSSQKKWNAHFWITFNFWWLAGLVNKLEPHPLPLSSQKMKCSFLDYFQFQVISQAGRWTQTPSTTPLQPKNEMLIFGLCSTSDDRPGWQKDCDPICHPSPTKKMKCLFLYYGQLLMISWAGW